MFFDPEMLLQMKWFVIMSFLPCIFFRKRNPARHYVFELPINDLQFEDNALVDVSKKFVELLRIESKQEESTCRKCLPKKTHIAQYMQIMDKVITKDNTGKR